MQKFAYYCLQSEGCRQLYRTAEKAILKHSAKLLIDGFTVDEVHEVLRAILTDNPHFFWFIGEWSRCYENGSVYAVLKFICGYPTRTAIQEIINQCVQTISLILTDIHQPLDRIRAIYDWLLDNIRYGTSEDRGQTLYGPMVQHVSVCKGLAKAFQLLLAQDGIFCTLQKGSIDGITGHVWNVVELDGRYYHVDVCMGYECFSYLFDSPYDRYRYFMVSDQKIQETHHFSVQDQYRLTCR